MRIVFLFRKFHGFSRKIPDDVSMETWKMTMIQEFSLEMGLSTKILMASLENNPYCKFDYSLLH